MSKSTNATIVYTPLLYSDAFPEILHTVVVQFCMMLLQTHTYKVIVTVTHTECMKFEKKLSMLVTLLKQMCYGS